jgi:hypothetical protein
MNEKHEITIDSLTEDLKGLRHGKLSPDARDRIWEEAWERSAATMEEAPKQNQGFFASLRVSTLRLAVAVQFVLIILLGTVGVAYASNQSLPGDILYPVKRNAEVAWLELTPKSRRPNVELALLERRVKEIQQLTTRNRPIPATLREETAKAFTEIAAHPEKWEETEALSQVQEEIEILSTLSKAHPESATLDEILQTSLVAFEHLGGDIGTLSLPPSFRPTPTSTATSTPTLTPTSTLTPSPTPTLTPSPKPTVTATPIPPTFTPVPTQAPETPPPDDGGGEDDDDPANPANPADPANPGEPGEPAEPAEPADPANPPNPADPNPPGQGDEPPGQGDEPPGQGDEPPGQSGNPPGQDKP